MKKLCKLSKAALKQQIQYRNCIYKCKKCGRENDHKKKLCKSKLV